MPALPPKADICIALHVQLWAKSGHRAQYSITLSGAIEQRWLHCDAERLGGLEVDHQLILGRIGRLLAFEDAIDVAGRAPVQIGDIDTTGQETRTWQHDQRRASLSRKCFHHTPQLGDVAKPGRREPHIERRRGRLERAHIVDP